MEQEILKKLEEIDLKVSRLYKIFIAIAAVSVVALVLPLIGLLFAVPYYLKTLSEVLSF